MSVPFFPRKWINTQSKVDTAIYQNEYIEQPIVTLSLSVTPSITPTIQPSPSITPSPTPSPTTYPCNTYMLYGGLVGCDFKYFDCTGNPSGVFVDAFATTGICGYNVTQSSDCKQATITYIGSSCVPLSPTPTPSITATPSITPSITPSPSQIPFGPAYLLIEPLSIAGDISTFMISAGSSFYGFSNESGGPTENLDIQNYLDFFSLNEGVGDVPNVYYQTIPQSTGGLDDYNNPIIQYNFLTSKVALNTVNGVAWYSWLIPDNSIGLGSNRQVKIDVSIGGDPTSMESKTTTPEWYVYSVTNPGGIFAPGTYRLYTTYVDQSFKLDNTEYDIYFKGGIVSS